MTDIFGRETESFGGAFRADMATIEIDEVKNMLAANMQIQYNQSLNRVFELGSRKTYYVVGPAQGQGGIGMVIGPKASTAVGYSKLGDPCKRAKIMFNFNSSACSASGGEGKSNMKRTMENVVATGISTSIVAQDMMINEQLSLQFANLIEQ